MNKLISDAVLLAAIYILSYFYVYCFEIGYAFYFGYPPNILPVTIGNIVHVWSLVTLYLVLLLEFLQLNMQYWPATQKHIAAFVAMLFLYLFLLITLTSLLREQLTFGNFSFNVLLAIWLSSLFGYGAGWVHNRYKQANIQPDEDKKDSIQSMFTIFDARSVVPEHSIGYRMLKAFGFDPIAVAIVLLVAMPAVSIYAGFAEAYSKRDFFVYNQDNKEKSYIIFTIQNGIIVSGLYDPKREIYKKIFFVKEVTDDGISGMSRTTVENLKADATQQP